MHHAPRTHHTASAPCTPPACAAQVVEVPGDHFSLLRQDPADMELIVSVLKQHLGANGWAETIRRDKPAFALPAPEVGGEGTGVYGALSDTATLCQSMRVRVIIWRVCPFSAACTS